MNHEISSRIRSNATKLFELLKISDQIKTYGSLHFTGSYELDLMTWNDIDMQIVANEGVNPMDMMTQLFTWISHDKGFVEAQLIHFKDNYKPKMPRGIYLGVKVNYPEFGGIWKLDFWALADADFEKNRTLIESLRSKLTDENRKTILDFKQALMQSADRPPQMASHFLYQAVLFDGIKDKLELCDYLCKKGVHAQL